MLAFPCPLNRTPMGMGRVMGRGPHKTFKAQSRSTAGQQRCQTVPKHCTRELFNAYITSGMIESALTPPSLASVLQHCILSVNRHACSGGVPDAV